MSHKPATEKPSLKERAKEELQKYLLVSLYLFVCFSALLLYKASLTAASATEPLPFGIAAIKALVIGKFILIGQMAKVGDRGPGRVLVHQVAWKTIAFMVMLIVFNLLEEIIVGWVHDRGAMASLAEHFHQGWLAVLAPALVMLLILVPLIAAQELNRVMGPGGLSRLMRDPSHRSD